MCYVFSLLALIVLVLFWIDKEFSLRAKFVATVIYLLTWTLDFAMPLASPISQGIFALALYFLMYPSGWGRD